MSKGLEALERLTNYKCSSMSEKIECKVIIETELKRLEELEKWSPLKNNLTQIDIELVATCNQQGEILRIIKEKDVDVGWFKECLSCGKPLEVYNDRYDKIRSCNGKNYHFMQLTQEEFDLLKEVLL